MKTSREEKDMLGQTAAERRVLKAIAAKQSIAYLLPNAESSTQPSEDGAVRKVFLCRGNSTLYITVESFGDSFTADIDMSAVEKGRWVLSPQVDNKALPGSITTIMLNMLNRHVFDMNISRSYRVESATAFSTAF